jgi:cyclopropane-fatty-acyl-phospholipid synthase
MNPMNTQTATSRTTAFNGVAPFAIPSDAPTAARTTIKLLQNLRVGSLTVQMPDGITTRFGTEATPHATLHLRSWDVCVAALKSGDIGFAETYVDGQWSTPNLVELLSVFIANQAVVDDIIFGSWLGRLAYRIRQLLNRNTKTNSRKNISAHYDLGNAFYALWLDGTMNYSSALFGDDLNQTMAQAQHAKVHRALRMAGVQAGDRVLEIGCGWGALAEMATAEFDAQLVGVTLSHEQLAWAQQRMKRLGTAEKSDLRLQDYRDIKDEPFDAICSIEMVEAVGREYWPSYFESVARLLKPGGRACIQSIVIADEAFERYLSTTDFIRQYIFPGGCLPCPRAFKAAAQQAGLAVVDEFAFGGDYAETLKRWREQFLAEKAKVLQQGFDERFVRIWEFYLAYCEAAFSQKNIDVVQYTLQKAST